MKKVLIAINQLLIKFLRFLLKLFLKLDEKFCSDVNIDAHKHSVVKSTFRHNMVDDKDEEYYFNQYWSIIKSHLSRQKVGSPAFYLDLGCGQGRFSIPLANWCKDSNGHVVAVDISKHAINQAIANAKNSNLNNLSFITADILDFSKKETRCKYDAITCLEVMFFLPDYKNMLKMMLDLLKPGGLFFVTFRPQYFNVLFCLTEGMFAKKDLLLNERSGCLLSNNVLFNWLTSKEVENYLRNDLGIELLEIFGIGSCSGILGDPHAKIIRPSLLSKSEKNVLMDFELKIGKELPDTGRYILTVSQKPSEKSVTQ